MLLKQKLDQSPCTSTPCAVDPERAIRKVTTDVFQSVGDDTKKEDQYWELMDDELMAQLISEVAYELDLPLNLFDRISSSGVDDSTTVPAPASEYVLQSLQKSRLHSESSATSPPATPSTRPHRSRHDLLYFIDSGGQPQFQEVLQAFIPNTTVLLLAFNLTQKLSELPLMNYQMDKGSLSLGRYAISNEEIISRFARMVYSSNENLQIAFLGTHRDLYELQSTEYEAISEKNTRLLEIFSFYPKKHLLFNDVLSESLLFPIDGLQAERGEFDDPVICQLRKEINSASNNMPVFEIPLRWYALELALKKHAVDHGCQVLSMETCIQLSKVLQFQLEEDVSAALQFLSDCNLLLYYPRILPNVVFTSPQVLLDKVTELTKCVYELSCHNNEPANKQRAPPSRGDYLEIKEGVISDRILQDFPKYYQPGLFSIEDLVEIFDHLYIISRHTTKGSYFMPALLPPFTPDELNLLLKFNPNNPPLLFEFTKACAPTGLFCALLVCLTSPSIGWEVAHHLKNAPLRGVRSNAACLTDPCLPFLIIIVDLLNQFEVHYRCDNANNCEYGLPQINLTITKALKKVIHKRKFDIPFPRKAFYCQATTHKNVGSNPLRHIAIPGGHRCNQLICSIDPASASSVMTPPMTQWLAPPPVADDNDPARSAPTIRELVKQVKPESHNWFKIGTYLDVPQWKLAAIESQKNDCTDRLILVFEYWNKNAKEHTNPFIWETIIEILRDIDNNNLADEIEKKFIG